MTKYFTRIQIRTISMVMLFFALSACFFFAKATEELSVAQAKPGSLPKNLVIFIGDGMGKNQLKISSDYRFGGTSQQLYMFTFPIVTEITTQALNNQITDSAASASAMATGKKYPPGRLSYDESNIQSQPETLLEMFKRQNKAIGLVTTDQLIGATPSAFVAHVSSRNMTQDIIHSFLFKVRPEIMLGGNSRAIDAKVIKDSGAYLLRDRNALLALRSLQKIPAMILGLFGFDRIPYVKNRDTSIPSLVEMAKISQEFLAKNAQGYFLLIEGGRIDYAAHENNVDYLIDEVLEFDDTIREIVANDKERTDTLYLVTADHETGGLTLDRKDASNSSHSPHSIARWHVHEHTSQPVFLFALGPGAEKFSKAQDNTDIYKIVRELFPDK